MGSTVAFNAKRFMQQIITYIKIDTASIC
jgi:hypothetical protein